MRGYIILIVAVFVNLRPSIVHPSTNKLVANTDSSFISYHVYHLFHSVDGISKDISCSIEVAPSSHRITSVSVESEVKSFNSGNKSRDDTAMKAIESGKYPEVIFQSDSISYDSDTTANVRGTLTFHGMAREVTFPVIVVSKANRIICNGSLELDFESFKVQRPGLMFIPIGRKFTVRFHLVFDEQPQ